MMRRIQYSKVTPILSVISIIISIILILYITANTSVNDYTIKIVFISLILYFLGTIFFVLWYTKL